MDTATAIHAARRPWPSGLGTSLALQRHTLVWLHAQAWQDVLARTGADAAAQACLAHWAEHGLPLVVTQQPAGAEDAWQLGVSAPLCWSRRRLFVSVPALAIARTGAFPLAADIDAHGGAGWQADWHALCDGWVQAGVEARVYGSHGWQALSGLAHVDADSDIDLLLAVGSAAQADAVVAMLEQSPARGPRLDGELLFPGGGATAWREWARWRRAGRGPILVKRLRGASLERQGESFA